MAKKKRKKKTNAGVFFTLILLVVLLIFGIFFMVSCLTVNNGAPSGNTDGGSGNFTDNSGKGNEMIRGDDDNYKSGVSNSDSDKTADNNKDDNKNNSGLNADSNKNDNNKPDISDNRTDDKEDDKMNESGDEKDNPDKSEESKGERYKQIKPIGPVDKNQWNLMLVNKDNYLPEDYNKSVKLETVQVNDGYSYKVDYRIADYLKMMIADAKDDGINLVLRSAYRTHSRQKTLYENRIQAVMKEDGLTEEEAAVKAATINAIPGTSEHELGLAVDILSDKYDRLNSGFEKTDAFKWLMENSYKYGFIMRYPTDKTDVTGIIYEPWHFRFVGIENSYPIVEQGICLEEYIERLS